MKVIDALQKIANGEEIEFRIERSSEKYSLVKGCALLDESNEEVRWYIDEEWLNVEVEVIEETKKIEKLTPYEAPYLKDDGKPDVRFQLIINQLNELIDYINDKENK